MRAALGLSVPNALSGLRILLAPILVALAWHDQALPFLWCAGVALFTDLVDGSLARRLGQASQRGAYLDSLGDALTWGALAIAAWLLWRERLLSQLPLVILGLASFALPMAAGYLKFGRLTSYHTWGAKLSALLLAPGVFALFVLDWPPLFQVATCSLALSALEELAITSSLPGWQADVRSLWHVLHRERLCRSMRVRSSR